MSQDEMLNKEIGQRIRAVRKMNKISQENKAFILGIRSTTQYQNIEYGKTKVTFSQLQILNEKFGASPNYILLGVVESEKEYIYDFLSRPAEEKIKIFIEIARHTFGGQHCDFEIQFKDK